MKLLVRITGEMMLKSQAVSKRFQKQLLSNLKEAMKREEIPCKVLGQWSRIWLETEDKRVFEILNRVFGVHGYTLIEHECAADLDVIVTEGESFYKDIVRGKTFAIQANRCGVHNFTSVAVNQRLGSALNRHNAASMVRLKDPEITVHVEIRDDKAYFYRETVKTRGGLPIGSAGHCLSLVSGGFDSTVASWMMQKRGVKLHYLFCNLAGESNEASVLNVMSHLIQKWGYGDYPRIHIVDFQPIVAEILKKVASPFSQVVLKRLFYKTAEMLARDLDSQGLITGEAISQVSSQTLKNLQAISSATTFPIYRPLVTFDKADIMQLAREIGVFEICSRIKEYCQIVPQKPVTACSVEKAEKEESYLDMSILEAQFAKRKVINLWDLDRLNLKQTYLFKDSIPSDAVILDCQSEDQYKQWHHPDATHYDFYDLLKEFSTLSKDKTYLIYCGVGTQSVVIAEKMQAEGYEAFSLRGGVKSLEV